jgi:hypothetical protein
MFRPLRLIFGGNKGVGSLFHVCTPELVFGGNKDVGSCFHVFARMDSFFGNRGRRVPFSCFARPDSFLAVPRVSGPVFMFCAPGLIFGGTECVNSCFHVLHSRTHFRRYRGRRVMFSCFARSDSFSAVTRATGLVFMFCALGLIFSGNEGVRSYFHVLRVVYP